MVPEGWKLTSLRDVCSGRLQTGPFGSQLHAHEYVDEGVPVLMPKDLINCRANLDSAAKISKEKSTYLKKHILKTGDLLFSRRGDVTRFALIDEESEGALCGTGCLKARPNEKHSSNFLAYFLQKESVRKWLEQNAVGQTMPNMNTEILGELPLISASSKEEEERIAQALSIWDKAITTTEQLLANSQQQKKALMQLLLTGKKRLLDESGERFSGEWEDHFLTDVAQVIVSPVDKKAIDGEIPVELCNYTDVYYNHQITRDLTFMKATAKPAEIEKYTLQLDDVIITKDSETPGDIAVPALVSEDLGGVVCGYHLAIVRPKAEIANGAFLNYLFSLPKTRYYFFTLATGATRFGLSVGGINKAHFRLPPLEEQKKIADAISITDQDITTLKQRLGYLKQEKKALMQQLLTGKRRVKLDA